MKKILLLLFAFLTIKSYGDIIIPKYTPSKIYVKITNVNDYPDIAIVGVNVFRPVSSPNRIFTFQQDSAIEVCKACQIKVYAVKKDYLNKVGYDNIDWEKDRKNVQPYINNSIASVWYNTDTPTKSIEISYTIMGFSDSWLILHESEILTKYDGDKSDSLKKYEFRKRDTQSLSKDF